jgi:hypothetical protein
VRALCVCGHPFDWHSRGGTGDCEHDGECPCRRFDNAAMFRNRLTWLRTFRGYTEDEATLAALAADAVEALHDLMVADTPEEQGAAVAAAERALRTFGGESALRRPDTASPSRD